MIHLFKPFYLLYLSNIIYISDLYNYDMYIHYQNDFYVTQIFKKF